MVEKNFSLKEALRIDEKVWRVLPKIQAREVRKLFDLQENTFQNFLKALRVKLEAEDYQYQEKVINGNLHLLVKKCPWYEIIKKSSREHLVPNDICRIDFQTWADEFHLNLKVKINSCLCGGKPNCNIWFVAKDKK